MSKNLKEMLEEAQVAANNVAQAINEGKSQNDIKALKKIATESIDRYNDEAAKKAYREWADGGEAVKTALTTLYIPHAKKVSYPSDKDTGKVKAKIADGKVKINLPAMEVTIGANHFHDYDWFVKVEALGLLIANALNKDLGSNEGFVYEVGEAAKTFKFAGNADITSKASMVKALQSVVDSIMFVPVKNKKGADVNAIKMETAHWVTIRESITSNGGVGKVSISGTGMLSTLIAEQCYQVLHGKKNALVNA